MKKIATLSVFALTIGLAFTSTGLVHADTAWQKKAGIGKYAPDQQNWEAIEAAAREEGEVVIYSVSSRIAKLVDGFKERYGIDIIGYDIASDLQLEKLSREHRAGVHSVDVLFNSESSILLNEALPKELVWNFIPESVASDLDAGEMNPLLIQRHSSRIVYYNTAVHPDGAPINSDEMAAAYKREFGEDITFSEDVIEAVEENATVDSPDASMEWLYRFLNNEPVFQGSTTKIFKNVGDVTQEKPPIGITTFSKLRKNKEGVYSSGPAYDLDPAFGVTYPTALRIADMAPHPNAAKLLIRYMMEEDGFKPWNEPGDYAARSNLEAKQLVKFDLPAFGDLGLWPVDPEEIYYSKFGFLALYLTLMP